MRVVISTIAVVVEFGAREVGPVIAAIERLVGNIDLKIATLSSTSDADLSYKDSELTLAGATSAFLSGNLTSLLATSVDQNANLHAMVFCPHFHGGALPLWDGSVELGNGYRENIIDEIRQVPEIEFVAISIEDDLDLSELDGITTEKFPWDDWRLIEAVVSNGEGIAENEIRRGPAARKVFY